MSEKDQTIVEYVENALKECDDVLVLQRLANVVMVRMAGVARPRTDIRQQPLPHHEPCDVDFEEVEIPPRGLAISRAKIPDDVSLYRVLEFRATESAPMSTGVLFVFVGGKMQMPVPTNVDGIPTLVFSGGPGQDVHWDTWQKGLHMVVWVRNLTNETVKWSARSSGRAIKTS